MSYQYHSYLKEVLKSKPKSFRQFYWNWNEKALKILEKVGRAFEVPVVTDIHTLEDAEKAAHYVDVLQIPALLVKQTDLLVAAAKANKFINLKKGQFMSPESMQFAVQKVKNSQQNIWITDRGTQFGYQ